jgi:hypothetical protein
LLVIAPNDECFLLIGNIFGMDPKKPVSNDIKKNLLIVSGVIIGVGILYFFILAAIQIYDIIILGHNI